MNAAVQPLCPVCEMEGTKTCKPCQSVSYCSVDHQRQDWSRHKNLCVPYLIKTHPDPLLGKEWIAARDLTAGTLLLHEEPLYHAPRWTQSNFGHSDSPGENVDDERIPNCLTCGLFMEAERERRCSLCQWPICSTECEQDPIHAMNECKLFHEKDLKFPPPSYISPVEFCRHLGMIRGMGLKIHDPSKFEKMMELQDTASIPGFRTIHEECSVEITDQLEKFLGSLENREEFEKLSRIEKINSFTGPFTTTMENKDVRLSRKNCNLYLAASRLNHSCSPNCTWFLDSFPSFKIRIRTLVDVKKGQRLTLCYDTATISVGTFKRQKQKLEECGFMCHCLRCLDPTELQSFMSGFTCLTCKDGALSQGQEFGTVLPEEPLDLTPMAVWKCDRCGVKGESQEFLPLAEMVAEELEKGPPDPLEGEEETAGQKKSGFFQNFIGKYENNLLHKNHWVLQKAYQELWRAFHNPPPLEEAITLEVIQKSLDMILYFLDNMRVTFPGLSTKRVRCWYDLMCEIEFMLKQFESNMEKTDIVRYVKICREAQDILLKYKSTMLGEEDEISFFGMEFLKKNIADFCDKYKSYLD